MIEFKFEFSYEDWKGPFSFAKYANALHEAFGEARVENLAWEQDELLANGFSLKFPAQSIESSLIKEIARCTVVVNQLADRASEALNALFRDTSLMVLFDFPEEIKVPCEQYLLYFVQFLKDVGVEATSTLEHQAEHVLFSVIPTNEKDALDKIHDALAVYLHLPSSPISDTDGEAISVQRLESNVLHLRSQLKLSAAEIQAKNATIQAQQLSIEIQRRLLSGEVLVDSIRNVTPNAED